MEWAVTLGITGSVLAVAVLVFWMRRQVRSGQHLDMPYDPSEGERFSHKWGYTDTQFEFDSPRTVRVTGSRYPLSGYSMPGFIPFVEGVLDVEIRPDDVNVEVVHKNIPEAHINEAFMASLKARFAEDRFSHDPQDRLVHSHGQLSVGEVYRLLYQSPLERLVDLVFYPEDEGEVKGIVELAHAHDACLIPYGGGTNVSGALLCPADERRMVVSVDMRRMDRILWIDEENLQACIEAGIEGKQMEVELDEKGYTSGHDPDSVELSTLGGWIATNASGMKKNRYGNIEDIVLEATLVTPTGDIETRNVTPRNSTGIQPRVFLFGSEGNFGIITKAVIKIHPKPQVRKYGSLVFPSFENGVSFLRELRQSGVLPASIRLVNNNEFWFGQALKRAPSFWKGISDRLQFFFLEKVYGFDLKEVAACTVLMEGAKAEIRQQQKAVFGLARKHRGLSAGAHNGMRGYALTFGIAYIRDFLNKCHLLGETFETSMPWSKIHQITQAVRKALIEQAAKYHIPGKPYLSYRVTQTYHTGVCVYFTMGFYEKGLEKPDEVFHHVEHALRQVVLDNGGSLSHHHGVGKIRQGFLPQIQTENSIQVLRQTKRAMDPRNVFGARNGVFADLPQFDEGR